MPNKAVLFTVPPDSEYTGVMVALFPSPELAAQIAAMDGVDMPAEALHVTLTYAGKVDALTDLQVAGAIVAAQRVAFYNEPLTGTINGLGRFNASPSSDGRDVIYAVVDVPDLDGLRSSLNECLEEYGIEPSEVHGYTAHMTLAYVEAGAPSPIATMPTLPLMFNAISVAVGGRRVDYPLLSMEKPEDMGHDMGHKAIDDLHCIKALGANRVGGYMVLWGNEKAKDLDQEWFTPATEEMTAVFKAMGKLPYLYNHATDGALKTSLVGTIDVMAPDDTGLWYEAQLDQNNKYMSAIQKLVKQRALGTSSGTLPGARQVAKSGQILRWPIVEGSMTPTPADPRQMQRPIAEIKSAYTAIGLDFPKIEPGKGDEESRQSDISEQLTMMAKDVVNRLKLLALLEIEHSV